MKRRHIKEYCALFEVRFVGVGDKLFANVDFERSVPPGPPEQTTAEEITLNSEGFYFFPNDTLEGVLNNHALASAVRVVWISRLAAEFPRRRFQCFVSNEYDVWPEAGDPTTGIAGDGVRTVLRLWSLPADLRSLDEYYRVDEVARDRVLWPEYDNSRLVPLQEVMEVIRSGSHPAREKTFRARWHA